MNIIFQKIFSAFSKTERIIFLSALITAIGSSVSLAGFFVKERTIVVPARGGNYVEGILGQPSHINPIIASSKADKDLVRLIFSNLGSLADKINADKSGMVWNVRLKENILWSDGEKITSDDAIFTIQKIQDPDSNSELFQKWQGVGVERVSELEFRITLGNPYALFRKNIENLYLVPKHLYAETPINNWRLARYNLEPVGSGPYVFDSYEIRDDGFITEYRFKANKFYFKDRPLITYFAVKFFSNSGEMINAFNAGQIDGFSMSSGEVKEIKRPYEATNFFMPSYYAVFFNQSQSIPLQYKNVRKALSLAVNREGIVKEALGGNGEVRFGPFSSSLLQTGETPNNQEEDPNRVLENDGWILSSSSIRQKNINGSLTDLRLKLTVPDIPFLIATAEKLKSDWSAIGVGVDMITLPQEKISGDIIMNRDYQALLFGNMPAPPQNIFSFWYSSQRFYPGMNLSLYNNRQADSLISEINKTTAEEKISSDIRNLESIISGDYPAVFLYSPYYVYVSRKDLQGVQGKLIDEEEDRFDNVSEWYIRTARSLK